jgi:transcriptional regulator with XRE-family HTH domain
MVMDSFHNHVRARLLSEAERQRLSDAELARRAGVGVRSIRRLWSGSGWQSRIVARISLVLGIDWS